MREDRVQVVKVWYQNDWGLYQRRDERLSRALAADPRVEKVLHLEPPVESWVEAGHARPAGQARSEGNLTTYTPIFQDIPVILQHLNDCFEQWGLDQSRALLWLNAPNSFAHLVMARFADRFRWRVTEVEDDWRHLMKPGEEKHYATVRRYERALRRSDLLVSNSKRNLESFKPWCPNVLHLPNAVDLDEYREPLAPGEEVAWKEWPGPRIGYVGNLRVRVRFDLFEAVARRFPECQMVLFGDAGDGLPEGLSAHSNVVCPGQLSPSLVPWFLAQCDVLMLPHAENALTDSMDPQKMYEYLASGRPVVATPVAGARQWRDHIELASTVEETVSAMRRALRDQSPSRAEARRAAVAGQSWTARVDRVLEAIHAVAEPGQRLREECRMAYCEHDRADVCALVPDEARRILDVGCGAGSLGQRLLQVRDPELPPRQVDGIELDPQAAQRARERLNEVWEGDAIERLRELPGESYDAVIFADILEHLAQPEDALREALRILAPDGQLVVSLPNVRHWSVLRQLLEGDFRYEDAGILDRTHLRFFTRRSAQRLFAEMGLKVEQYASIRWDEQRVPAPLLEALREAGLQVEGLDEEARDEQMLFRLAPVRASRIRFAERSATKEKVTVIVPVHGAVEYTQRCLEGLQRTAIHHDLEVVVVDNASRDETPALLRANPWVTTFRNAENLGFSAAVNQGLRAASGVWSVVLNNDVYLPEGWLRRLLDVAEASDNVGLIGPCTNYANGRQQLSLDLKSEAEIESFADARGQSHRGDVEDVSFLSGFCMMGRSEQFRSWGFSEDYKVGTYEDNELSRLVRREGKRLLIARESFVFHFGNRTFLELGEDLQQRQALNAGTFEHRHRDDDALRARVALAKGEVRQALQLSAGALRTAPRDLDALWTMCSALALGGSQDAARRALRRYQAVCSADPQAERLAARSPTEALSVHP